MVWGSFVDAFFMNLDPQTLYATLILAIPAFLVGWLMFYFDRRET